MKKILNNILVLGICSVLFSTSCVDRLAVGDAFLEKAPGVDVNIDTVFSSAEYTRNFLWSAYGQIYCAYTSGNMINGAPIDALSDSYHCYCTWGGPIQSYYPGSLTEDAQDTAGRSRRISPPLLGAASVLYLIAALWICFQSPLIGVPLLLAPLAFLFFG